MNTNLTPNQRRLLQNIAEKLRTSTHQKRKVKAADRQLLNWCAEQDLISNAEADAPVFVYTVPLLNNINQRLQQLGFAPFETDQAVSSLQQAEQGKDETKSVREAPRAQRILTAQKSLQSWTIIDCDYRALDLDSISEIIVVENLDCFYAMENFAFDIATDSLVVYRGDSAYSTGRKELLKHWRHTGKPIKYFGDLDAKGFHIAQSEGFTHIAVPAYEWFKANANSSAFNPAQANLLVSLNTQGALRPYHQILKDQHRAILQQWLQNTPLQWCET